MAGAKGLSAKERFWLGCLGSAAPWIFRSVDWLITTLGHMSPSATFPDFGWMYIITAIASGLGILLCVIAGGLWSYALKTDEKWLAVYHGAAAPHIFLFVFGVRGVSH